MELIIIRHGQPVRIDPGPGSGDDTGSDDDTQVDPGLTDVGHAQSRAVAAWLSEEPIDAIYASPLRRARETAAPLVEALGLQPIIEPGLTKLDSGPGYIPVEQLKRDRALWDEMVNRFEVGDHHEFRRTVAATIKRIIDDHPGQVVAVVCHAGVINAWAAELLGIKQTVFFGPEYTAINRFRASSGGHRSLISLNESAHLRADQLHRMP